MAISLTGVPWMPRILFNTAAVQTIDSLTCVYSVQTFAFLLAELCETSISLILEFL